MFRQDRIDLLFRAVASGEVDEARGHVNIAGPRTSHHPSSDSSPHYLAYGVYIVLAPECFVERDLGDHFFLVAIKTVERESLRFNLSRQY